MKVIAIAAVTAGGKTTVVNELIKKLPNAKSLHFDDYSLECVRNGSNMLQPLDFARKR